MPLELPDDNLSEEQRQFRDMLRGFFEEHAPIVEVRRVLEGGGGISAELWKRACDELGLAGIAIAEAHGGQGFGLCELAIALGECGRSLAPVPLFASAGLAGRVVAAVLETKGTEAEAATRWLSPIAAGQATTLAWLEDAADWRADRVELEARPEGQGFRLTGEKHFVLDIAAADRIFVVARSPGSRGRQGLGLYAVERAAAGVYVEGRDSLDITRGIGSLRLEEAVAEAVGVPASAGAADVVGPAADATDATDCAEAIEKGLGEAAALLCSEMVGGMQRVLEMSVDYARGRYQFGRAVGSFQAVKHKCADMLIDFECGRTAADAAVVAHDEGDPEAKVLTAVAKAHIGPAYVRMSTENIQVHGGVGFTWEYDPHLYFRRAHSSAAFLGDAAHFREEIASAHAEVVADPERLAQARAAGGRSRRRADTPEEAAFRAEVRAWFEKHAERLPERGSVPPVVDHSLEAERIYWDKMKAWQRTRFDGGWAAITWAKEHGGRGGTPVESIIFGEEQAAFDVTSGFIDAAVGLIGPALIRFGTDAQRERFLKPMLRGEEIWCQLFSEPEAGSDLAAVRTRGVIDGDELVLNGQKVWTTSAQYADWGFIVCRTNPEVPKHKGISFALVDMRQPGVEVRPLVTMKGDRHFNEVFFNDVRTPLSNVVNGIDQGWPVTTFVLMNEGTFIGTSGAGRTQTLDLISAAHEAGRFGDSQVRQRLAETFVEERVLELLQARLKAAILDGRRPDVDGSVLKLLWSEGGHRKAETAIWLQGAYGLLAGADAPLGGIWQDHLLSRGTGTIGGGTSEVHRNGLGERALGLPREPRLDRDQPFKDLKTSG